MAGSPMGLGGMPFMPGGMGGFGGGGRGRERKTWLKEDEKVWGTHLAGGEGLVGRPDGEPVEAGVEEFVLPAGPVRQPRRVETADTESGTEGWGDSSDSEAGEHRHRPTRAE
jgi:hypothetical protein